MDTNFTRLVGALCLGGIVCLLTYALYNIFLHPLAKYNGLLLWQAFRLPFVISMITGDLPHQVKKLHDHYGTVVRLVNKIMLDFARFWPQLFPRAQERVVQEHVDLLMEKLRQEVDKSHTNSGTDVNVLKWFNYTAFDIIGDFVWSSSFGCLDKLQYHPWIQVIAQFKTALILGALKFYPPLDSLLTAVTPKSAMANLWMIWRTTEDKIAARLQYNDARADVMSHMIAASKTSTELHMTPEEVEI
ncbi:MAG: hypothetical protein Q9190_003215 [Brigantiaea leucoxantha]